MMVGTGTSGITQIEYADDGTFVTAWRKPSSGWYPNGTKVWFFSDGERLVNDRGAVLTTRGLMFSNRIEWIVRDIAFHGSDVPIVLYSDKLTGFNSALLPTGSVPLSGTPRSIVLHGDDVLVFKSGSSVIQVEAIPLEALDVPEPGTPVDPNIIPFVPDGIFADNEGVLHLFSKGHPNLFRWDIGSQQYLETIPLAGIPERVAYSGETHTVYLGYYFGLIRQIDLNDPEWMETPFADLNRAIHGLATAGQYVYTVNATFAPDGAQISDTNLSSGSREFIWSDANQKMYSMRISSPLDLLWGEINANGTAYPELAPGAIGKSKDSPLHNSAGFEYPIRVSRDGTSVVLGSGVIHDGTSLERRVGGLANSFVDASWGEEHLFSIRETDEGTQLQRWAWQATRWNTQKCCRANRIAFSRWPTGSCWPS